MSSQSAHSPSTTLASIEEEVLSPHISPISSPINQIDQNIYDDLRAIEDDLLACCSLEDDALLSFGRRWADLKRRILEAENESWLSEETLELADTVDDFVAAVTETLISGEHNLEDVSAELLGELSKIFDADSALAILPPKPSKSKSSSSKHKKPHLQSKRSPTELPKTHRKRRAESGIPGQESLKFRPCRDFFMEHLSDPYPNPSQKQELMRAANISAASLNQWFTNTRRRSNWMDIMKDHANGRKEEMKLLVERALARPSAGLTPVPDEVKEAVLKMRTYVDELAREVISEKFLAVLEELKPMNEAEALQYQDNIRSERKKKHLMRKESKIGSDDLDDADLSDDEFDMTSRPSAGDKRKRTAISSHGPVKRLREAASPSFSSISVDNPRQRLKRSRDPSPATDSLAGGSHALDSSPAKKARLSSDEEEPTTLPDLSRRRTTVLERHQTLSSDSTMTDSLGAPGYDLSPSPAPASNAGVNRDLTFSFGDCADVDWPNGISTVDIAATVSDLAQGSPIKQHEPYEFKFDPSAYSNPSPNSRVAAIAEWASSLSEACSPEQAATPPLSAILASPSIPVLNPHSQPSPQEVFWEDFASLSSLLPLTCPASPQSPDMPMASSRLPGFDSLCAPTGHLNDHPMEEYSEQHSVSARDDGKYHGRSFYDASAPPMPIPSRQLSSQNTMESFSDYTQPTETRPLHFSPQYSYQKPTQFDIASTFHRRWNHDSIDAEYTSTPSTMSEPFLPPYYATAS